MILINICFIRSFKNYIFIFYRFLPFFLFFLDTESAPEETDKFRAIFV